MDNIDRVCSRPAAVPVWGLKLLQNLHACSPDNLTCNLITHIACWERLALQYMQVSVGTLPALQMTPFCLSQGLYCRVYYFPHFCFDFCDPECYLQRDSACSAHQIWVLHVATNRYAGQEIGYLTLLSRYDRSKAKAT